MYIDNWDSFYQQAEELYRSNPLKTRYVTKYRHCDGKLALKVTDDRTVSPVRRGMVVDGAIYRRGGALVGPLILCSCTPPPAGVLFWQVLQYKTDQQADLKKVEKLNQLFFSLMATGDAPSSGAELACLGAHKGQARLGWLCFIIFSTCLAGSWKAAYCAVKCSS